MLDEVTKLNWLYFDFDSYFASVEQQLNIHLRDKPIAIVPLMSDSTCAIAASVQDIYTKLVWLKPQSATCCMGQYLGEKMLVSA